MKKNSIQLKWFIAFIVCLWLIQISKIVFGYELTGLIPRKLDGLTGIITMPFLHGNMQHLISNSLPLLILGILVYSTKHLPVATSFIVFIGGILVWLFGRPDTEHIGASGLVMGYWGFLIAFGWFHRSIRGILIALISLFIYGGLFFTLVNFQDNTSFEAHIFGFLSGVFCAWYVNQKKNTSKIHYNH